jgi:Ca2+-binding EF-hand superfamily protein
MRNLLLATVAFAGLTGLALAAASGSAADQPPGPPSGMGHRMGQMGMHGGHGAMLGSLITRYDANGDGSITRAEIDAGIAKDFKAADTGHDGKLSSVEITAFVQARHAEMIAKMKEKMGEKAGAPGGGQDGDARKWGMGEMDIGAMMLKHLDWNRDGTLSFDEFSAPIHLAAMRLDDDGNGTITATDLLGQGHGDRMGEH